jgi:hypothetical protein
MVSPLSSRIINLEAKAKIKKDYKASRFNASKLPWQLESRRQRISGYTADREGSTQVVTTEKQIRANLVEASAKKRKIEELNFQAHNVKKDLANADMTYAPRSRALPAGVIDMSNVELVMASKYVSDIDPNIDLINYQDSNSDTDNSSSGASSCSYISTTSLENISSYMSLIEEARSFYKGGPKQKRHRTMKRFTNNTTTHGSSTSTGTGTSTDPSTTNSMCSSTTSLSSASTSSFLSPGLEEKVEVYKRNSTIHKILYTPESNEISLDNALISCDTARLIIDPEEPHNIIHANASFSRLSGIPSDQLVNESLSNILVGEQINDKTVDILFSSPTTSTSTAATATAVAGDNDNQEKTKLSQQSLNNNTITACKYMTYQVLSNTTSGTDNKSHISHFVIDFEKYDTASSSSPLALSSASASVSSLDSSKESMNALSMKPMVVIG